MARQRDNPYSRFVNWAKVVLPLAALALLSTLFLIARGPDTSAEIPYADLDVEDLARDPRISDAYYSGLAADGTRIAISAGTARPEGDGFEVQGLSARLERDLGLVLDLEAETGQLDRDSETARLAGPVRIVTSDGYRMVTSALTADLATGAVLSDSDIEAEAPFGTITAGQLEIEAAPPVGSGRIVFKDGVKLIYQPPTPEESRP
ncbi:hypothetical protein AAD018_001220 [Aestuariibius insulae]|uniref:hypothetical protein n=1 Tax=Aestuariibius insulae TaxID=2058287 RepID=UPI00345E28F2